jgi:hypothetical protein
MHGYEDDDASAMEDFLASSPPAWNANIPVRLAILELADPSARRR